MVPVAVFAVEESVNISDMEITAIDAVTIQNQFNEKGMGTAEVTNESDKIKIKLLKDITGRIKFENSNGSYIIDADGHTFSAGTYNEAILINHSCSGLTLELVGNGTYNDSLYAFFVSGGDYSDNTLIIKSATINGRINTDWYDPIIQFALENGYDYFTVKNNGTNLFDEKNITTKTITDDYIGGTGTGLVVAQHIDGDNSISLDTTETHNFPLVTKGYGEQEAKTVTITNTGNKDIAQLTIGLSDGNFFAISTNNISNVTTGSTVTFTVQPKTGLNEGTYIDTVTVSGSAITSQSFDLKFTVNAAPPLVTHVITATAITGGSISPSGSVIVNNGESKTFTITPNRNYSIADVKVDGNSQGPISTYTFSSVTEDHTISATFKYNGSGKKTSNKNSSSTDDVGYNKEAPAFTDIENHWAKEDIEFVVSHGLFSGTSDTTFSPDTAMTRGMFLTVLGRLANVDVDSYNESSFNDVKSDAYYMGYIEWAIKNNIIKGIGNGNFAPEQAITREQMAVIMSNYAKIMDIKLTQTHGENTFADSANISAYAKDAVQQMQMEGILRGKNGNLFDPQGTATRAEISAVLHRFVELIHLS
jgi:hypothetical protein